MALNRNDDKPANAAKQPAPKRKAAQPRLLSGGNPQIAKADGDAPVQAYLAAMPGWKRDVGRRLDALVTRTVPLVRKAVKWNSPLYGIEGQGWFLGIHTFTHFVKVTFFRGSSLRPVPPGASKSKDTRYVDIREGDEIDEALLSMWIRQAAALPGGFLAASKTSGKQRIGEIKRVKRATGDPSASKKITNGIAELGDRRGQTLARVRKLIHDADPQIQEEWKWAKATSPGVPVWSHDGIVCTGESYKEVVKLTFAKGASLKDPKKLFNSSLEGNTRRAIDIRAGEKLDEAAFKQLIRAAVAANYKAPIRRSTKKS